jgi:2-dehydropantoate 2-reductase
MRKTGLRLDSELGPLHLDPVKVVADTAEIPAAQAIIFAVKMRDTESAAERLRGLTKQGASVFTFQNGVESVGKLGAILGADRVVPGVARIGSHISEPGVIKQIGTFCRLEFGEADGKPSARTTAFKEACTAAGFEASIPANVQREVWMKFGMLAPLSGLTALTRTGIGPIRSNPQSRALLEAAVRETVAVGAALKAGVGPDDAPGLIALLDSFPPSLKASMAHDLFAGKPIEIDGLSGAVARLAGQCGVPAPTHKFIAQALAPFAAGAPQV